MTCLLAFDAWLRESMLLPPAERDGAAAKLGIGTPGSAGPPAGRHEHLLPLMVCAAPPGIPMARWVIRDR